jgi:hypothetical protein
MSVGFSDVFPGIERTLTAGLNDGSQVLAGLGLPITMQVRAGSPIAGTAIATQGANIPSSLESLKRQGFVDVVVADVQNVVASPMTNWVLALILLGLVVGGIYYFRGDFKQPILK